VDSCVVFKSEFVSVIVVISFAAEKVVRPWLDRRLWLCHTVLASKTATCDDLHYSMFPNGSQRFTVWTHG